MRTRRALVLILIAVPLLIAALAGCEKQIDAPGPLVMTEQEYEAWEIALVEMRIEKNEDFGDPATTPLQEKDLPGFEGLNYFFPVREMVFRVPLTAAAGTDTVSLTKRKGEAVPYLRRGHVSFRYGDAVHTLAVFGPADPSHGEFLWLPFYDETSGKSTYGGGRYLDIEIAEDGLVDLDFNYAYNPLCDYSPEKFNCTLPPLENKLPFAVEAGEMIFHTDH